MSASQRGGRIAGLDVIRGIAVGLVVLRHAWPHAFGGAGVVGVVVFFGLSGYLITGLIANDVDRLDQVRFRRFYVHRIFRLIPALLFLLAGFVAVSLTWDPAGDAPHLWRSVAVGATYVSDLPHVPVSSTLGHLWTLAVEEQFYIVWPTLLLVATRMRRRGSLLVLTGVGIWLLCAATLLVQRPAYEGVYTWPSSWSVVMVIGAAARLKQDWLAEHTFSTAHRRTLLGLLSLVVMAAVSLVPEAKSWPGSYLLLGPIIGAASVSLVFWMREWRDLPTRLLVPLLALGTISYAVYLWDFAVVQWLHPRANPTALEGLLSIPIVLALATISYFLVEQPAQRWRRSLEQRRREAVAPVAVFDAG